MFFARQFLLLISAVGLCALQATGIQAFADDIDPVGVYGKVIPLTVLGRSAIGVQVERVQRTVLPLEIRVPGRIEAIPIRQYDEHAPLSGRVTSVLVWPGAKVKQGQVLATIDSLEMNALAAQLLQSKLDIESENAKQKAVLDEEVEQAQQRWQIASANQRRTLKLFENKIAPQKEVLAADSEAELAKTRLQTAKENRRITLKTLQSKIDLTLLPLKQRLQLLGVDKAELLQMIDKQKTLTSVPVVAARQGIITSISASPGKSIDPSVRLFTIADLSKVWATAQVYEDDMARMKIGERVEVKVQALAGETVSGVLTYIGNQVDAVTKTLPVRAEIDNANFRLKPDMYAELSIETAQPLAMIALPKDAVVQKGSVNIIFVENGNGYQPIAVKLGRTIGNLVEIVEGLQPGQSVVTRGAFQLGAQLIKIEEGEGSFSSPVEGQRVESDEKILIGKSNSLSLNWQTAIVGFLGAFLLGFVICALVLVRRQVGAADKNSAAGRDLQEALADELVVEKEPAASKRVEG